MTNSHALGGSGSACVQMLLCACECQAEEVSTRIFGQSHAWICAMKNRAADKTLGAARGGKATLKTAKAQARQRNYL